MLKYFVAGWIFLFIPNSLFAQTWELGGFAGGSGYMGDLNPIRPYQVNRLAYGGFFKRNIDPYWSIKLSVLHGEIAASDANSGNDQFKLRNLSFFTPINELSLQAELNFFNYIPSVSKKRYTPFLFTGFSLVSFNPRTVGFDGNTYELNLFATEGQAPNNSYKTYSFAVPFGAGVKCNLFKSWSLIGEIGYRTAFTDYLDDVSGKYPDPGKLVNPIAYTLSDRSGEVNEGVNLGFPGTQRGDYRPHDTYFFVGAGISFTFLSDKCYTW